METNEKKLQDYITKNVNYVNVLEIFIRYFSGKWGAKVGYYIMNNIDISQIPKLQSYPNKLIGNTLDQNEFILANERILSSITIHFISSVLNENSLSQIVGNPISHDGGLSYFERIGNVDIHILINGTKTKFEVRSERGTEFSINEIEEFCDCIKIIVNRYAQNLNF